MCGGKNTSTSTSTQPNAAAMGAYNNILNQASGVASTPYTPYTGELVPGINPQMTAGINQINQYANAAQPDIATAENMAQQAASPITAAQIQEYENPYTQAVVNATQNQFNNQNAITANNITGNAISQGALGGNRVGVAQGIASGQEQTAQAPVIANLENQGYQTGLNTALTEQGVLGQGALSLGNLALSGQGAGLAGANSALSAGLTQNQIQAAIDAANYGQFQNQQAYPYQQLSWLSGIDTGVGSNMGGTSQTTPPPPSLAQYLGLGIAGAGAAGQLAGGLGGSAGLLSWLSDRRAKENIEKIGKLNDGQIIYRFNYKGDPATRIGLIAQDVERHHPEAVHHIGGKGGLKTVDYDEATRDSIKRANGGVAGFDTGGGVAPMPYSAAHLWIPSVPITHGRGPPAPPNVPNQQSNLPQQANQIGSLARMIQNPSTPMTGNYSPLNPSGGGASADAIYNRGGVVRGYADGGSPNDDYTPDFYPSFADRPSSLRDIMSDPAAMSNYAGLAVDDALAAHPDLLPPSPSIVPAMRGLSMPGSSGIVMPATSRPANSVTVSSDDDSPFVRGGVPAALAYSDPGISGESGIGLQTLQESAPISTSAPISLSSAASNPPGGGIDLSGNSKLWPALMTAGFGMAASRSPYLGVAIGEGGLAGMGQYSKSVQQEKEQALKQSQVDLEVKKLSQLADQHRDEIALRTRPFEELTAGQKVQRQFQTHMPHIIDYTTDVYNNKVPVMGTVGMDGTVYDMAGKPYVRKGGASAFTPPPGLFANPAAPGTPAPGVTPLPANNDLPPSDVPQIRASGGRLLKRDIGGSADVADAGDDQVVPLVPPPASVPPVELAQAAGDIASDAPLSVFAPQPPAIISPSPAVQQQQMLYGAIPGVNYDLKGEAFLNQFSPDVKAEAKNWVAGLSSPVANPRSQKGQFSDAALVKRIAAKYAEDIGEPFDDTTFTQRRAYRNQLGSTSPQSAGGQRNLLTTSLGHLAEVAQAAENMHPSNGGNLGIIGAPLGWGINASTNYGTEQHGNVNNLLNSVQRYQGEAGKLYGGSTGGSATERLDLRGSYPSYGTGYDYAGALISDRDLMMSKVQAMEKQRNDILGKTGSNIHFLSPIDYENYNIITGAAHRLQGQSMADRAGQLRASGLDDNAVMKQLAAERWPGVPGVKPINPTAASNRAQVVYDTRAALADPNLTLQKRQMILDRYSKMGGNPADLQ